ncbi:MAG TPA: hypothetical protein PKX08_11965, partial [Cyclobacteriaceae bacterium]|nr:hypothetical protein [Cyclobacteriaceae bacterium]
LKVFRAVWFLSLLGVFANLMYVYAGLPEQVSVAEEGGATAYVMDKDALFYAALAFIAILNVLVYLFSKSITPDEGFRAWLHGLVITLNIFFVVAFSFIGLYNSAEVFDFTRIGSIIYGSVILVCLWAVSWPLYSLGRRLFAK